MFFVISTSSISRRLLIEIARGHHDGPYMPASVLTARRAQVPFQAVTDVRDRVKTRSLNLIGVGTGIEPAPPSEPDRRVSRIRLSS
jgi:hypothetical protein